MQDTASGSNKNTVKGSRVFQHSTEEENRPFGLNFEFCNWGTALWRISDKNVGGGAEFGAGRWSICKFMSGGLNETYCSAIWKLGAKPAFVLGLRKITEQLEPAGQSQDLSDAVLLLANSWTFKYAKSSGSPYIPAAFLKVHDFEDLCLYKLSLKFESLHHREHSLHHKDEPVTPI